MLQQPVDVVRGLLLRARQLCWKWNGGNHLELVTRHVMRVDAVGLITQCVEAQGRHACDGVWADIWRFILVCAQNIAQHHLGVHLERRLHHGSVLVELVQVLLLVYLRASLELRVEQLRLVNLLLFPQSTSISGGLRCR